MTTAIRCSQLVKHYDGRPPVEAVRVLEPTEGDVEVLGLRWGGRDEDALRHRLGISLQETRLSEKLTVRETLTLFRSFYRHGIEPDQAIAVVSLEEKANA